MFIYRTYFRLDDPVCDVYAARDYLAAEDMTVYLREDKRCASVSDSVASINWILREDDGGYIELRTIREFTTEELAIVSEWVSGQNSDGLGEGFEQQSFACYNANDPEIRIRWKDYYTYDDDEECWVTASFDWKRNEYLFEFVSEN